MPSTSRSGGRSATQMSVASGQRGTNGQPVADGLRRAGGADAERLAGGPPGGLLGRARHRRRRGQRDACTGAAGAGVTASTGPVSMIWPR